MWPATLHPECLFAPENAAASVAAVAVAVAVAVAGAGAGAAVDFLVCGGWMRPRVKTQR